MDVCGGEDVDDGEGRRGANAYIAHIGSRYGCNPSPGITASPLKRFLCGARRFQSAAVDDDGKLLFFVSRGPHIQLIRDDTLPAGIKAQLVRVSRCKRTLWVIATNGTLWVRTATRLPTPEGVTISGASDEQYHVCEDVLFELGRKKFATPEGKISIDSIDEWTLPSSRWEWCTPWEKSSDEMLPGRKKKVTKWARKRRVKDPKAQWHRITDISVSHTALDVCFANGGAWIVLKERGSDKISLGFRTGLTPFDVEGRDFELISVPQTKASSKAKGAAAGKKMKKNDNGNDDDKDGQETSTCEESSLGEGEEEEGQGVAAGTRRSTPPASSRIAAPTSDSVFFAAPDGSLFLRKGMSETRPYGRQWVHVKLPHAVTSLTASQHDLFCVEADTGALLQVNVESCFKGKPSVTVCDAPSSLRVELFETLMRGGRDDFRYGYNHMGVNMAGVRFRRGTTISLVRPSWVKKLATAGPLNPSQGKSRPDSPQDQASDRPSTTSPSPLSRSPAAKPPARFVDGNASPMLSRSALAATDAEDDQTMDEGSVVELADDHVSGDTGSNGDKMALGSDDALSSGAEKAQMAGDHAEEDVEEERVVAEAMAHALGRFQFNGNRDAMVADALSSVYGTEPMGRPLKWGSHVNGTFLWMLDAKGFLYINKSRAQKDWRRVVLPSIYAEMPVIRLSDVSLYWLPSIGSLRVDQEPSIHIAAFMKKQIDRQASKLRALRGYSRYLTVQSLPEDVGFAHVTVYDGGVEQNVTMFVRDHQLRFSGAPMSENSGEQHSNSNSNNNNSGSDQPHSGNNSKDRLPLSAHISRVIPLSSVQVLNRVSAREDDSAHSYIKITTTTQGYEIFRVGFASNEERSLWWRYLRRCVADALRDIFHSHSLLASDHASLRHHHHHLPHGGTGTLKKNQQKRKTAHNLPDAADLLSTASTGHNSPVMMLNSGNQDGSLGDEEGSIQPATLALAQSSPASIGGSEQDGPRNAALSTTLLRADEQNQALAPFNANSALVSPSPSTLTPSPSTLAATTLIPSPVLWACDISGRVLYCDMERHKLFGEDGYPSDILDTRFVPDKTTDTWLLQQHTLKWNVVNPYTNSDEGCKRIKASSLGSSPSGVLWVVNSKKDAIYTLVTRPQHTESASSTTNSTPTQSPAPTPTVTAEGSRSVPAAWRYKRRVRSAASLEQIRNSAFIQVEDPVNVREAIALMNPYYPRGTLHTEALDEQDDCEWLLVPLIKYGLKSHRKLLIKQVSLSLSMAWVVTVEGIVFVRTNVTAATPLGRSWGRADCDTRIESISINDGSVIAVSHTGAIYTRRGFSSLAPYGTHWMKSNGEFASSGLGNGPIRVRAGGMQTQSADDAMEHELIKSHQLFHTHGRKYLCYALKDKLKIGHRFSGGFVLWAVAAKFQANSISSDGHGHVWLVDSRQRICSISINVDFHFHSHEIPTISFEGAEGLKTKQKLPLVRWGSVCETQDFNQTAPCKKREQRLAERALLGLRPEADDSRSSAPARELQQSPSTPQADSNEQESDRALADGDGHQPRKEKKGGDGIKLVFGATQSSSSTDQDEDGGLSLSTDPHATSLGREMSIDNGEGVTRSSGGKQVFFTHICAASARAQINEPPSGYEILGDDTLVRTASRGGSPVGRFILKALQRQKARNAKSLDKIEAKVRYVVSPLIVGTKVLAREQRTWVFGIISKTQQLLKSFVQDTKIPHIYTVRFLEADNEDIVDEYNLKPLIRPHFSDLSEDMILFVPIAATQTGSASDTSFNISRFVPARVVAIDKRNRSFNVAAVEPLLYPSKNTFSVSEVFVA